MKTGNGTSILVWILAFVAFSGGSLLQAQPTIQPGTTTQFVVADGSREVVSSCTGNNHCVTSFSNDQVGVATILVEGQAQQVMAQITAFNSFVLSPGGNSHLGALLNGMVNWEGYLDVGSEDGARADIAVMVEIFDVTDNKSIAIQTLHDDSCSAKTGEPCFSHDTGSAAINLFAILTRGHSYEIRITAECMSEFASVATDVICAYIQHDASYGVDFGDGFVSWSNLALSVQEDFSAEISELRTDLNNLILEVQQFKEEFANHTHIYKTGKGVGHNNTDAVTSTPIEDEQTGNTNSGGSSDNGNGSGNGNDKDKDRGKGKH